MADTEFVLTYPCFFLLSQRGQFTTVLVEERRSVALFTDEGLVRRFCQLQAEHGPDSTSLDVIKCIMEQGLVGILIENETAWAQHQILHLAIDPTKKGLRGFVQIRKCIEQLSASSTPHSRLRFFVPGPFNP
jgi:hypothetical protein